MKSFVQLWQFFAPFKSRIALSLLLGFLTISAGIGLMATSGYLIASAALHPETILLLWVPIVGVRFFGLSRSVFRYLERYVSHDLTFRILARLRVWLYQRIEPAAPAGLQNTRSGDVLSTLTSDVDTLQNLYLRVLAPPVTALFTFLLVYAIVSRWNAGIASALIALLLLAGVGSPLLTWRLGKRDSAATVQSRAAVYTSLADSIHGMTELLMFGQAEQVLDQLKVQQTQLSTQQKRLSQVSGLGTGLTIFVQNFSAWAVLFLAIPLVNTRQLTGVSLTALVLTTLASFEAVGGLAAALPFVGQGLEAAKRVFTLAARPALVREPYLEPASDIIATWPNVHDDQFNVTNQSHIVPPAVADRSSKTLPSSFDLVLQTVNFSYPTVHHMATAQPVLCDVSFELPHGKHIAIVGASGSGKSTLVELLLRFWEYEGSIRLGNQELRGYMSDTIRNLITVVPQQPYLFHTSIAENLRVAKPDATLAELRQVLESAELTDRIATLPEGVNTLVGEQGTTLSGGERQRIALARAFLQSSPIWVLDEPTNGLDAVSEQEVLSAIQRATINRSLLLITHRLVGMEKMDEILVMEAGHIAERGTHAELLEQQGLYYTMWETVVSN